MTTHTQSVNVVNGVCVLTILIQAEATTIREWKALQVLAGGWVLDELGEVSLLAAAAVHRLELAKLVVAQRGEALAQQTVYRKRMAHSEEQATTRDTPSRRCSCTAHG